MTLREQLTRLHELIGEDVFTDAPEKAETVGEIRLLHDSIRTAIQTLAPDAGPLDREGMMSCPQCGIVATPFLVERGYTVNHEFRGFDPDSGTVRAAGFSGLHAVSEAGDEEYVLRCYGCGHEAPFPQDLVIEWE